MEMDIDPFDTVLANVDMPNSDERQSFAELCHESFSRIVCHGNMNRADWAVFVYLLLQMGFVDLSIKDKFFRELDNPLERSWCYKINEDGRISCIRLEPGTVHQKIPSIIRRLDGLRCLYLTGKNVTSFHLQELSILPHLQELNMVWIKGSLMGIADQIRSENPPVHWFKSLRKLTFLPHDSWDDQYLEDPETKEALKIFLDFFVTIDTLKFPDDSIATICPAICPIDHDDWKYSLIKNNVGRRIMEGERSDHNKNTKIPPSLWPRILERAQQIVDERSKATGIYFLLREGPILTERRDLKADDGPSTSDDSSSSLATLCQYTRDAINNVENYLAREYNKRTLPRICARSPFSTNCQSELDLTANLSPTQCSYYQSQTYVLRRIYELGRTDIFLQVEELESHMHSPRPEHLEALFRVFSYLNIEQIGPLFDSASLSEINYTYDATNTPYMEDDIIRSDLAFHQFIRSTSSQDSGKNSQHSSG